MRLFVAIELPEEVRQALANLRREVPGVRWVRPQQLHLTLLFLGEVTDDGVERLRGALSSIRWHPFSLTFTRTGCFPHARAPRVLWIGLKHTELLEQLACQIWHAAASCGCVVEERPFRAHITLARVPQPLPRGITPLLHLALADTRAMQVHQFALFQSTLTPHGALHQVLQAFPAILSDED